MVLKAVEKIPKEDLLDEKIEEIISFSVRLERVLSENKLNYFSMLLNNTKETKEKIEKISQYSIENFKSIFQVLEDKNDKVKEEEKKINLEYEISWRKKNEEFSSSEKSITSKINSKFNPLY